MANKLDPMDLKQIITLHLDGKSNRAIGTLLGISRNTVNSYMQLAGSLGRNLSEPETGRYVCLHGARPELLRRCP
jgi:DNA-directed RNA polymerase specialized sigma24 family protein